MSDHRTQRVTSADCAVAVAEDHDLREEVAARALVAHLRSLFYLPADDLAPDSILGEVARLLGVVDEHEVDTVDLTFEPTGRVAVSEPVEIADLPTLPVDRRALDRLLRQEHDIGDEDRVEGTSLGAALYDACRHPADEAAMSPVQALVATQRYLAHLLAGRLIGVQIMADLTPEHCCELVAAGGTRSDPSAGVVSLVSLEVGGIEIVGVERPALGSPEAIGEELAFERIARDARDRYGPTGDDLGRVLLTMGAREVYCEVRAEQLAHRRERDAEDDHIRALELEGAS